MRLRVSLWCLPAVLAGCASTDPDPGWAGRDVAMLGAGELAPPEALLRGFDAPGELGAIEKGDRILLGLRLDEHGERQDWFVVVEVLDPRHGDGRYRTGEPSWRLVVRTTVHDGAGTELGREEQKLSRRDLARGLARACRGEGSKGGGPLGSLDSVPETVWANLALLNLLGVIRKSPILSGILWRVVDKPSLLSVLLHLGARVTQETDFAKARRIAPFPAGADEAPTWEVPGEVLVNGAPALRYKLVVTDPKSPLALSAGVLAIHAAHPGDPAVTFRIRLLAARRGAGDT